ncbi:MULTISPECIES: hypothetical protein [unclassified Nocardia]|uniref:hypothetical protein n=1 Tax=unclassified Nocardia TaxID=2637762 RepID=UPI001CE47588|nr:MULTISPECIES: hypothetical protein [unclassified Nocardia]
MTESSPSLVEAIRVAVEFLAVYMAAESEEEVQAVGEYVQARLTGPNAVDSEMLIVGQLALAQALLISMATKDGEPAGNIHAYAADWLNQFSTMLGNMQL